MSGFKNILGDMYVPHRPRLDRDIEAACRLLSVEPGAAPDDIRAAFAAKVKESHPDTGGSGGDIQQLKKARDLLIQNQGVQPFEEFKGAAIYTCKMCNGSGRVAVGFSNIRCNTCNGTGGVKC